MTFFGAVKNAESAVIFIFPLTEMQFTPLLFFLSGRDWGKTESFSTNKFNHCFIITFILGIDKRVEKNWKLFYCRLILFLRKKDSKFLLYLVGGKF